VDDARGALPYALIHGEALVACAAWALGEAWVTPVDASLDWGVVVEAGEPFVLHDALCPMTPPDFIAECVETSRETGAVVVGVRPVTDTVKVVADGLIGDTVDREGLLALASPVVVPASLLAGLGGWPGPDLSALVTRLAATGHTVTTLTAPPEGRRVASLDAVRLLEALTAADEPPGRRLLET
jgi:2-C-methyl-D-erythritol 4-phosphate cytidylyltransferase